MTNLESEEGLEIYRKRMKIGESFRDLKNLLGMHRLRNKKRGKILALLLLVYAIGLLVGQCLRDFLYGEPISPGEQVPDEEWVPGTGGEKRPEMERLFWPVCPAQAEMVAFLATRHFSRG